MPVILANWRLIAAGCAVAAIVGFITLALHWRKEAAVERTRADQAVTQNKADVGVSTASDATQRDVRVIVQNGQKEVEYVQTLPGADTPTDPARRDGLCAAIGRVLDNAGGCDPQPDADPAPAL